MTIDSLSFAGLFREEQNNPLSDPTMGYTKVDHFFRTNSNPDPANKLIYYIIVLILEKDHIGMSVV